VGRSLLSRVLQEARTREGVREVRLTCAADNRPARALFAQAGFEVEREDDGTFAHGQRATRMRWSPRRRVVLPAGSTR
jgi:RimJ/RimL family protein N-acetyltransferase